MNQKRKKTGGRAKPKDRVFSDKQINKATSKYKQAAMVNREQIPSPAKARRTAAPASPSLGPPAAMPPYNSLPAMVQSPPVHPVGSIVAPGQHVDNPVVSGPVLQTHYLVPAPTPTQVHPGEYLIDEPKPRNNKELSSKIVRGAK